MYMGLAQNISKIQDPRNKSPMKRIVIHWTGGTHKASDIDKQHYHFLVEGDGTTVEGYHPISDNESTSDGIYAAHVRGMNTGSIGIAMCAMAGAQPNHAGHFPMLEAQWLKAAKLAGELCEKYGIGEKDVIGHYEAPNQRGKWDPSFLPWAPEVPPAKAMDLFRKNIKKNDLEAYVKDFVKTVLEWKT